MDVSENASASRYEALMAEEKKGVDMTPAGLIDKLTSWIRAQNWFAGVMIDKMMKNTHKTGWKDMSLDYLAFRIEAERNELRLALVDLKNNWSTGMFGGDAYIDAVIDECADIANFAMMCADNARRLKK